MSICVQPIHSNVHTSCPHCQRLQQALLFNSVFGNTKSYVSYEIDCYCYINISNTFEHYTINTNTFCLLLAESLGIPYSLCGSCSLTQDTICTSLPRARKQEMLNIAYLFLLVVTSTENFLPAVQFHVQISSPIPQDTASTS